MNARRQLQALVRRRQVKPLVSRRHLRFQPDRQARPREPRGMIPIQSEASPIEIRSQGRGLPDEAAKGDTRVEAKGAIPVVSDPSAYASANGDGGAVPDRKRIAEIRIVHVVHACAPPVEADADVEACTAVVRAACETPRRLEGDGVNGERDAKVHRGGVPASSAC